MNDNIQNIREDDSECANLRLPAQQEHPFPDDNLVTIEIPKLKEQFSIVSVTASLAKFNFKSS
jgi:hypothetical protein